ncbi:hypothetical protein C0993_004743 [Termitomyces sp. T159_Od127]|nr:hypothetical protein C0993_004743 [Termitomyces sp. T159_Od127]
MTTTKKSLRNYLVVFNAVSCAGWAHVLVSAVLHLCTDGGATTTYTRVGSATAAVQSLAVLEVLHVLLGWVRSPLLTTAAQVASRLLLVWGIVDQFAYVRTNPAYTTMVLSWSTTEVVRYAYYALARAGYEPRALLWLRYTTFYVLYITGATSEALLIYATLRGLSRFTDYVRLVLFVIWWPGLYTLYTYMMAQRRKRLAVLHVT